MADIFDKEKRSEVMRSVKSKENKSTEMKLIEVFKDNGITGWRRNYAVKGHPDFVFLNKRIAIFVDGCFWHGHDCRNTTPKDNADYWQGKIKQNRIHDREITDLFRKRGWNVLRIWECEMSTKNRIALLQRLEDSGLLKKNSN